MNDLTLAGLSGGKAAVLANLANDPAFKTEAYKSQGGTMERAATIAQSIVRGNLYNQIYPKLEKRLAEFVARNGPRPPFPQEQLAVSEWDSAIDDDMADVLEPYADILSADWLGRNTVDTRVHAEGELPRLASSFAKEAWRQLTYEKNTTAKILSAVGIVGEDIDALLRAPKVQEATQVAELEPDMSMNAVLNKIMLFAGNSPNVRTDLALALHEGTDPYIKAQSMERLGLDDVDVETLAVAELAGYTHEAMSDMLATGELLDEAGDAEPGSPDYELGDGSPVMAHPEPVDLSALAWPEAVPEVPAVEAALPDAIAATTPPPAPAVAVQPQEPAPLPAATVPSRLGRKPRPKGKTEQAGQIPRTVLEMFKDSARFKDEDGAALLGVSRATYNNFVTGKTPFVPTDLQRKLFRAVVLEKLNGVISVLSMLDGEPYDPME